MAEKKIVGWYTWNVKHYPIFEGESKQDAYNRSVAKDNEDKKAEQIAKNKEQADKLNGKAKYHSSDGKKTEVTVHQKEHDDSYSVKASEKDLARNKTEQPSEEWGKYVTHTYKVVKNHDGSALVYRTDARTGETTSTYYRYAKDAHSFAARRRNAEKASAIEAMNKAKKK